MRRKIIPYNPKLKELAKKLRKNMTMAEALLWNELKQKRMLGHDFDRQRPIDNFIVDFYCASERLIIELDGEVHNNPQAQNYDTKRTNYLNKLDYTVIRFENKLVFDHLAEVLQEIQNNFKS